MGNRLQKTVQQEKDNSDHKYVSRYTDIAGRRFGMLTALEKRPESSGGSATWRCRCDCGKECDVTYKRLKRGTIKDCGCIAEKEFAENDLTGKKFGHLTVLKRITNATFICICDCGKEKEISALRLKNGEITSCGCMRGKQRQKNIAGIRSGKLVAMELTDVRRGTTYLWRCRCDCGNEILLEAYKITGNLVQSCGCGRKMHGVIDLSGQRFGKLTAVERLDEKRGSSYLWHCRCDCGRETKVSANALMSGGTRSCGCGKIEKVLERVENGGSIQEICHFVEGTCVELIKSTRKLRSDNTSGYTGVQARGGKWVALITFKKKVYYLGSYSKLEDAVQVRKQAEERLFGEFLEWYYDLYGKDKKVSNEIKRTDKKEISRIDPKQAW